jgi:hypothetical protein
MRLLEIGLILIGDSFCMKAAAPHSLLGVCACPHMVLMIHLQLQILIHVWFKIYWSFCTFRHRGNTDRSVRNKDNEVLTDANVLVRPHRLVESHQLRNVTP